MKRIKVLLIFLVFTLFFLVGCNPEMLQDPNYSSDKIKFKNDITVNLKENVDTTKFIDEVDNLKVKDSNRDSDEMTVSINNYIINCPTFTADKLGTHTLTYKLANHEYKCDINVKDTSGPKLTLETDLYEIIKGDKFTKKDIKIKKLSDNSTKQKDIKIKLSGKYDCNKTGEYKLKITATDKYKNTTSKKLNLFVYDKPTLEVVENISLKENETYTISPTSTGKNNSVFYFTSENSSIATVNNIGVVKAIHQGNTKITVSCSNGLSKEINVNVIANNKNQNNSSNNNSSTNNNNKNNNSNTNNSSNASSYNKFFSGNSIAAYNNACDYADSLYNQRKIKGYEVKPTGDGFMVTCY